MTPDRLASILVRAACFLAAGIFIVAPLFTAGRTPIVMFVLAVPFVLAGLAPRLLGPAIGKGLFGVAVLYAFWDPPSSIAFNPQRLAEMIPFFALALMLAIPELPQALARCWCGIAPLQRRSAERCNPPPRGNRRGSAGRLAAPRRGT